MPCGRRGNLRDFFDGFPHTIRNRLKNIWQKTGFVATIFRPNCHRPGEQERRVGFNHESVEWDFAHEFAQGLASALNANPDHGSNVQPEVGHILSGSRGPVKQCTTFGNNFLEAVRMLHRRCSASRPYRNGGFFNSSVTPQLCNTLATHRH